MELDPHDPETRRFPTNADAQQALADWNRQLYRMPGFWLALAAYTAAVAATAFLLALTLRLWIPMPTTPAGRMILVIAAGPILGACIWLGATWIVRRRYLRFLRRRLVTLGVPICLACGYDLRGQELPRCPECGRPTAEN